MTLSGSANSIPFLKQELQMKRRKTSVSDKGGFTATLAGDTTHDKGVTQHPTIHQQLNYARRNLHILERTFRLVVKRVTYEGQAVLFWRLVVVWVPYSARIPSSITYLSKMDHCTYSVLLCLHGVSLSKRTSDPCPKWIPCTMKTRI